MTLGILRILALGQTLPVSHTICHNADSRFIARPAISKFVLRRPPSAPRRLIPSGFVAPCLPTLATRLSPSTWQTATVRESLPEPPAASRKRHSSCLARRQFVAAKDRHRVEHLTGDKSLEVASELREVLGTQVSFAPSKAVAGQHRTAGAVQSL